MITILQGDVVDKLRELLDGSVHCVITSPPYWGLRDYGIGGQYGLEKTPEEYVEKMMKVFQEVKRILRDDGTVFLNMGDCYCGSGTGHKDTGKATYEGEDYDSAAQNRTRINGLKPKDLVGMPWRLAFALQADGWYLRSDIIWSKPNPMPESVTDRPTKSHEYIFLLSMKAQYFYDADAIRECLQESSIERCQYGWNGRMIFDENGKETYRSQPDPVDEMGERRAPSSGRNRRTVWEIATQPFPEAHFATFPEALVEPCIKAGTSERGCCPKCGAPWERIINKTYPPDEMFTHHTLPDDGLIHAGIRKNGVFKGSGQKVQNWKNENPDKTIGWQPTCKCGREDTVPCVVLDPFVGSGTTLKVARDLKRDSIGIELNPEYVKIARRRLRLDEQLEEV